MVLQFLLEGQEEIGSPNLAELLQENAGLLKADIALSADGGQISAEHVSGFTVSLHPCTRQGCILQDHCKAAGKRHWPL